MIFLKDTPDHVTSLSHIHQLPPCASQWNPNSETWFTAFMWLGFACLFPHLQSPKFQTVSDGSHFHTSASCHFYSKRVSLKVWELLCFPQGPATALALRQASSGHLESSPLIPNEHLHSHITSCLQVCSPICLPAKERAFLTAQSVLNHGHKQYFP